MQQNVDGDDETTHNDENENGSKNSETESDKENAREIEFKHYLPMAGVAPDDQFTMANLFDDTTF